MLKTTGGFLGIHLRLIPDSPGTSPSPDARPSYSVLSPSSLAVRAPPTHLVCPLASPSRRTQRGVSPLLPGSLSRQGLTWTNSPCVSTQENERGSITHANTNTARWRVPWIPERSQSVDEMILWLPEHSRAGLAFCLLLLLDS